MFYVFFTMIVFLLYRHCKVFTFKNELSKYRTNSYKKINFNSKNMSFIDQISGKIVAKVKSTFS